MVDRPETGPFEPGMFVVAQDGTLGMIEEVIPASDTDPGEPGVLVVRDPTTGELIEVPLHDIDSQLTTEGQVRFTGDRANLATQRGEAAGDMESAADVRPATDEGDRLIIPTHEEVLVPSFREVELGAVTFTKRVETVPVETTAEVYHDQVEVERVPIDREIDAMPGVRQEGETLVVPVVEEVLVTEKRLMLREEVRITRRQVSEQVPVHGTVRREVLEIAEEPLDDIDTPVDEVDAPVDPAASRAGDE